MFGGSGTDIEPLLPHAGLLLEKEPNNIQAQSLNQLVEQAVSKGASLFLRIDALVPLLSAATA